jgi:hypothetical protein
MYTHVPLVTYDCCLRDLEVVLTDGLFPDHRPEGVKEAWPTWRVRMWMRMTVSTGSLWLVSGDVLGWTRVAANWMFLAVTRGGLSRDTVGGEEMGCER